MSCSVPWVHWGSPRVKGGQSRASRGGAQARAPGGHCGRVQGRRERGGAGGGRGAGLGASTHLGRRWPAGGPPGAAAAAAPTRGSASSRPVRTWGVFGGRSLRGGGGRPAPRLGPRSRPHPSPGSRGPGCGPPRLPCRAPGGGSGGGGTVVIKGRQRVYTNYRPPPPPLQTPSGFLALVTRALPAGHTTPAAPQIIACAISGQICVGGGPRGVQGRGRGTGRTSGQAGAAAARAGAGGSPPQSGNPDALSPGPRPRPRPPALPSRPAQSAPGIAGARRGSPRRCSRAAGLRAGPAGRAARSSPPRAPHPAAPSPRARPRDGAALPGRGRLGSGPGRGPGAGAWGRGGRRGRSGGRGRGPGAAGRGARGAAPRGVLPCGALSTLPERAPSPPRAPPRHNFLPIGTPRPPRPAPLSRPSPRPSPRPAPELFANRRARPPRPPGSPP